MQNLKDSLKAAGKRFFEQVNDDFDLREDQLQLLYLAAQQLDVSAAAAELIAAEGYFVQDRFGTKRPHPAIDAHRKAAACFQRLRRELGLDADDVPEFERGPLPTGYR